MLIHVKIEPESNHEEVVEKSDTSYLIKVKEPAERNLANAKMLELLALHLKIDRSKLRIITGHHARGKIVEIL